MNRSNTPGGWKSRSLWVFLILCLLSLVFLGSWIWAFKYAADKSFELSLQNKEIPAFFNLVIQNFPLGALITGLGAAASLFIGGNRGRDIARNLSGEKQNENKDLSGVPM